MLSSHKYFLKQKHTLFLIYCVNITRVKYFLEFKHKTKY